MDDSPLNAQQPLETELRERLHAGFLGLRRLPTQLEVEFRQHARERSASLISKSIYLLIALYLLVVTPISLFSTDPALRLWQASAMLPIALALAGIWLSTQLARLQPWIEEVLGLAVVVALTGTLFCAMHLGTSHFGQMAAFETIYILIIVFSVLRLPTLLALQRCLVALLLALAGSLLADSQPLWLHLFLYFGVPLLICTLNGYMLEHAERRSFVQNLLLSLESQRLTQTRQQAEAETRAQQRLAEFQSLIAGNLSRPELFGRALRFLLTETRSLVGAAYRLNHAQELELLSHWGCRREQLATRNGQAAASTLMGPALARNELLQLQNLPEGYLPIESGSAEYRPGHVLIIPVLDDDLPVAVLELGKFTPYDAAEQSHIQQLVRHFAHAVLAAEARVQLGRKEVLEAVSV